MAIDKIGSKALVDCSVAAADIAPGTITTAKLAGSITNAKLANTTVTINGTSIALGASAGINPVSWQSVVVSDGSTVTTMVAGRGYFVNNTSAAGIVKLPISASAGDTVAIKDYAGNFGTNSLTIQRNGHKIQGNTNDSEIKTNRASVQLVYIDATKGWLFTNESNVADLGQETFINATGGTVSTVNTNFKVHTFTGDGNFVVASASNVASNNKVGYLVVAGGGGGGGRYHGAGGGAGGFREGRCSPVTPYTDSPLSTSGHTVSAQTYPISVGGGGAGGGNDTKGTSGSNSVFSTITSAGGGGGANYGSCSGNGLPGGSGGGASTTGGTATAGSGNTPPVSPPQGFNGGSAPVHSGPNFGAGGGGGAEGAGGNGSAPQGGSGRDGLVTHVTGSPVRYAGGGGGSSYVNNPASGQGGQGGGGAGSATSNGGAGGTNKGGGGGGVGDTGGTGGAGGKGIVVIRYKFQ